MKYARAVPEICAHGSLPVRGAWIEIRAGRSCRKAFWSLPVRGAWIEICYRPLAARR